MTGPKTNERPGTKAVLRHFHMSASKARVVLNLIRGEEVQKAAEILNGTEREAARVCAKVLASAVANAVHNDGQNPDDLYVAAAFADEGATMKRWRPRARGRATRINKRTCHITIIVARMDEDRLERLRTARIASGAGRQRRVAESQRRADQQGRGRRRDAAREAELEAAAAAEAEGESTEATETDVTTEATDAETTEVTATETSEIESKDETADVAEEGADAAPAGDDVETEEKGN